MLPFLQIQVQNNNFTQDLITEFGMNMFDEEIDDVIFATNQFLTDPTFTGHDGPFWWILQMSMALGALFAVIMAAGMGYKMLVKGEVFDILKILKVIGIATVMTLWYPTGNTPSVLGVLAYIPNVLGSYTYDLYKAEAAQVQDSFVKLTEPLKTRRDSINGYIEDAKPIIDAMNKANITAIEDYEGYKDLQPRQKEAVKFYLNNTYAGIIVFLDKIVMFIALVLFRFGWWATIYCQQIILGMLTIFGPIQWAFSILPKWEGAWAKWIMRYLTAHLFGAMLFFVGFYVLLLFDVALSVQYENLTAVVNGGLEGYVKDAFMTGGYLLCCSMVAVKCLSLVPELAAWILPEGEASFAARSFGEGIGQQASSSVKSLTNQGMSLFK